jgi:hypothetical protein
MNMIIFYDQKLIFWRKPNKTFLAPLEAKIDFWINTDLLLRFIVQVGTHIFFNKEPVNKERHGEIKIG